MKRRILLLLAVLATAFLIAGVSLLDAAGGAKEDAVKKELQALKGTWRVISREVDGKKASEEELKGVTLTRDETGKFSVRRGDKLIVAGVIKIDPTKKPKTTDVTYTGGEFKGQTALGIYEIEGDTYRGCVARPGGERPKDFSAKAGSGHSLIVYKREKK
jgi:uncharacterized protein (TIGR03067 family)